MEKNKKKYIKKNLYEKKTKKKLDRAGGGAGGERRRPCRRSAPPAAPRRRSRRIHIPRRRIRPRRPRICRPPPAPQLRAEQRRQAGIEEGAPATVADVCGGSRGQRADGGSKGRGGVCAASGRAARRRGRGAAAPRWIRRWGRTSGAGDGEKGDRGR